MSLFAELRRRNVFRVAAAYGVLSWLLLQVGDVLFETLELPAIWSKGLLAVLLIGVVPVLLFAWVYEMTPEGLRRESEIAPDASATAHTAKKLDVVVIILLVAAIGLFAFDRFAPKMGSVLVSGDETHTDPVSGGGETYTDPVFEGAVADDRPAVAVLPFTTRSRNEDDVFFSDGVHDDLLTQLAKIGGLKVISRTSVMEYRETTKNLRDIGVELDVGHIVEGAIQRSGDQVRITAQLIDAATDEHLWAETYDRELTATNLFALQTEIATSIAAALETTLTPEELEALGRQLTDDLEALAAYQRAFRLRNGMDRRSLDVIEDQLDFALERDPEFAAAYALRARNHLGRFWSESGDPADRELARVDIERARELAPGLPEVDIAESYYHYWGFRDYERALVALDAVRGAYPNDPETLRLMSWINRRRGEVELSLEQMRESNALSPRDSAGLASTGRMLIDLARYAEADELVSAIETVAPNAWQVDYLRGYRAMHRDGDAAAVLATLEPIAASLHLALDGAWRAAIILEDWQRARRIAARAAADATIEIALSKPTLEALTAHFANDADADDRLAAAVAGLETALAAPNPVTRDAARLAACLLLGARGMPRAREVCLGYVEDRLPDLYSDKERLPWAAGGLGMAGFPDEAFGLLEEVMDGPFPLPRNSLLMEPRLMALRSDPRWEELLERAPP